MQRHVPAALQENFGALPPRQQEAARWMLDHPVDVALLSLREQARRAGVTPATFTRLAQRLGYDGYETVREVYAETVRTRRDSFRGRAAQLQARRDAEGDDALVQDTLGTVASHLRMLSEAASVARLSAAADRIAAADRVFCLGLRSSFPVAYLFHYVRSLFGAASVLVDSAGGIGADALRVIGPSDVLLAVTVKPYTRQTVDAARYGSERGAHIVAITDSVVSPLAKLVGEAIVVRTETPSFFHTMAPAFAAAECLAALVAARKGGRALAALEESEKQLAAFNAYLLPTKRRIRR
jgi:DNA-binding MurR/RpiR family transcriptional regulator